MKFTKLLALAVFTLALLAFGFSYKVANAQVPSIKFPCTGDDTAENFHSLRPYQASPCGDADKALFCSNNLIFIEGFDMAGKGDCKERGYEGEFLCSPDYDVPSHDLTVELDDSDLPILGNTENVQNQQGGAEELDDAQKVNEYVSWYLSGVTGRAEYGDNPDKIIDYSGPIKKLLPSIIQDAQRIKSIDQTTEEFKFIEESDVAGEPGVEVSGVQRHNQIVVCADGSNAQPCPTSEELRLSDWRDGDLGIARSISNKLLDLIKTLPAWATGATGQIVLDATGEGAWNRRTPPLPWSDEEDKPFESDLLYRKAYNEWRGKSCLIIPTIDQLVCFDNPGVVNKWADLFPYVPLSSTVDKKGAEYLYTDPQIRGSGETEIANEKYGQVRNAPLYFAHTQEDKDLAELLNKTYMPEGVDSIPLPETTEENDCRVVDVRYNDGDDLFPGDPDEIQVPDVSYTITRTECKETVKLVCLPNCVGGPSVCCFEASSLSCPAEVTITLKTKTKSPWAEEIWKKTVADSGSTFRKIFPKVEEGAPVSCIANMPTQTGVTYTATNTLGSGAEFKVRDPGGGTSDNPKLYFPFIGSVYEYFLKGIQTALRPQGYGTPIKDGAMCAPRLPCGELPELPKASGACTLGGTSSRVGDIPQSLKDIVEAAAQTYQVPANLVLAVMYGEGAFNLPPYQKYEWTDENIKNWATCEPMPNCDSGTAADDDFLGFFQGTWDNISKNIAPDLQKLDPNRTEPDRCNLIDAVYGAAWDLKDSADGSPFFPSNAQCLGIPLNRATNSPSSCSWNDSQYESAIRVWEFGTGWGQTDLGFYTCATKPDSCATGGGQMAQCETDTETNFDTCPVGNNSHNQCLWDVAHGN